MSYNLEAVRNLLNAAFSSGEIKTLAFDRFYEVYEDFSSGMTKSTMIEAIVVHAKNRHQIPHLLDYVRSKNPYQYNRFENQLQAVAAPQTGFGNEQRLQDLQRNIKREADLLNEYEALLTTATDPRQLRHIQSNIERQKKTIAGYEQEAAEIQSSIPATAVQESNTVQKQLDTVNEKLDQISSQIETAENRLIGGQETIRQDLRQQQNTILAHIDAQHRQTISTLVEKMDSNQLELTELMLDAADQQQIAQWEAEQLIMLTQHALREIQALQQVQPDSAEWKKLLDALANETEWKQKLKITVPLIPGIVGFESEMAMDVVPALSQLWDGLVSKVKSIRA